MRDGHVTKTKGVSILLKICLSNLWIVVKMYPEQESHHFFKNQVMAVSNFNVVSESSKKTHFQKIISLSKIDGLVFRKSVS